jgi:hypothetical protein
MSSPRSACSWQRGHCCVGTSRHAARNIPTSSSPSFACCYTTMIGAYLILAIPPTKTWLYRGSWACNSLHQEEHQLTTRNHVISLASPRSTPPKAGAGEVIQGGILHHEQTDGDILIGEPDHDRGSRHIRDLGFFIVRELEESLNVNIVITCEVGIFVSGARDQHDVGAWRGVREG